MNQIEEKKWFVFLGDHHEGPFSMAEIQTKFDDHVITDANFVWAEGMTDWKLMKEIPEFGEIWKKPEAPEPRIELENKEPIISKGPAPTFLKTESLVLDRTPLDMQKEPSSDKIEKAWKRRRLIRRMIWGTFLTAACGGGFYVYQTGMWQPWLDSPQVHQLIKTAMDRAKPELLKLSEKYPILAKYVSPIPQLEDVTPEDYAALRAAAAAHLNQVGPKVAIALSKKDPLKPVFYVSSNLPDGAQFDIYIEGSSDTLLGQLNAEGKCTVTVFKKLGTSEPIQQLDGKPLPPGDYQVFATENANQPADIKKILDGLQPLNAARTDRLPAALKMLARKTYFLGGVRNDDYSQKLRAYHDQLKQKSLAEVSELKQVADKLNSQVQLSVAEFKAIRKRRGRGISSIKKKAWTAFHLKWMKDELALIDMLSNLTPETLRDNYVHGDLYELARQTTLNVQKLHDLQDAYFQNQLDAQSVDIQVGAAQSVAQNAVADLSTKIEQLIIPKAAQAPLTGTHSGT